MDILEEVHGQAVTAACEPLPYDCSGLSEMWQVKWREATDRGGWLVCQVMGIFQWLGFPSTAWYHDQAIASGKEVARAFKAEVERRGGKCSIYPMPVDVLLPFEPIREARMWTAPMSDAEIAGNTMVAISRQELAARDEERRQLRELVAVFGELDRARENIRGVVSNLQSRLSDIGYRGKPDDGNSHDGR